MSVNNWKMERLPVFVRLRPTEAVQAIKRVQNRLVIDNELEFETAAVLDNSSQELTFRVVGRPLVEATIRGISSTLLAYGGIQSGKTYSLTGGKVNHERGIIPRSLEMLVQHKGTAEVAVSVYEVRPTDHIVDLLHPGSIDGVTCTVGGNLRGISTMSLKGMDSVRKIIKLTEANRTENSHQMTSVTVLQRDEAAGETIKSQLLMVDLASAGRCSVVSRQLSLLEHVVVSLGGRSKTKQVPYRECRLTHTLQGSLSSDTNTALLCTIRPDEDFLQEALASLRFASRASKMPISKEVRDRAPDPFLKVTELNREIESLKRELSVQSLLTRGKSTMGIEALNANQIAEAQRQVEDYLAGGQYPDVISNRQLCAVFTAFRQVLAKVTEEMRPKGAPTPVEDTKGTKSVRTAVKGSSGKQKNDVDEKPETPTPKSAKRGGDGKGKNDKKDSMDKKGSATKLGANTPQAESILSDETDKEDQKFELAEPPDRESSYKMFREGEGRVVVRLLRDAETQAIEMEKQSQDLAEFYNKRISVRNELKRIYRDSTQDVLPDGRPVIDEQKLQNLLQLKKLKQEISDSESKFHVNKAKAEYCREQARKIAERVVIEFNQWESRTFQSGITPADTIEE